MVSLFSEQISWPDVETTESEGFSCDENSHVKEYEPGLLDAVVSLSTKELQTIIFGRGSDRIGVTKQECEQQIAHLVSSAPHKENMRLRAAYVLGQRSALSYENLAELSSPSAVGHYCFEKLEGYKKEHFLLLCLNTKNELLGCDTLSIGTLDKTIVGVRDIIKRALELCARSIILVHNHPSGDPHPSPADISLTHQVQRAAQLFDVQVHDHVILGTNERLYSLRSQGDM